MRVKSVVLMFCAVLAFSACDTVKQVAGSAYNVTQCKYDFNNVSKLSISGMDVTRGISIASLPQIMQILGGSSSSIPLNMTVNLDVTNPNQSAAVLSGLSYILSIDGVDFTSGNVNKSLNVPAGGSQTLPVEMGFDLKTLLSGDSAGAATNIVKNLIGIGNSKSEVTLKIKPVVNVAGFSVPSPVYIPVSFSFGGSK